ncbi:hypothetical protein Tsubulata_034449 [Turnera subulata]|uniref:FAS1 domain-containing protein n=1 Tax=Turnera subulata TaxID=218843 RepID=A0A9Q0F5U6_9ROSI|nr:hypothetical protein Tsubulata_034449 [Turnera subulata]
MKMRRSWILKNSIALVGLVVSLCCLFVILISVLRLPEVSRRKGLMGPYRSFKSRKVSKDEAIGKLGEMMIEMLPEDLAFTVFVPSEKAFEQVLRLRANDSLVAEKKNDTYAVVSRILGFSAVPRVLSSTTVPSDKEVSYDSLSGFPLFISKDADGRLVVNRIRSQRMDLMRGEIVVHIMNGVIMDADFEQSVYNEED